MKNDLTDADFSMGDAQAWSKEELENLSENFLATDAFKLISQPANVFLAGRRGSGKSAIAVMLEAESPYEYKTSIEGENEVYGAYMDQVRALADERAGGASVDVKQAIRRLWLWVLPLKAMQTILERRDTEGGSPDDDIEAMKTYFASLPEPLHQESRIGDLLANMFRNAVRSLQEGPAELNAYLINLTGTKGFRRAVKALSRKTTSQPVLLVFDTLESYRVFETAMIEGLQGILEAIQACLANRDLHGISVKFFIPAEIYDAVVSVFPGKVQSKTIFLRWQSGDLMSMLARRYLGILERTEAVGEREIESLQRLVDEAYAKKDGRRLRSAFWYDTNFLPERVNSRRGVTEDCFAYMLRHTQRRPRDVIYQMQRIVNESRKRREFPHISADSVVEGVHDEDVLQQIMGGAVNPYEGWLDRGVIAAAQAIFYRRPALMPGRQLRRFAQELYSLEPWADVSPDEFVDCLLRCGLIGLVEKDKHEGPEPELYCTGHFEYLMQGHLPVSDRFLYCVHPVMADLFHMLPPEGRGAVYPMPTPREDTWLEDITGIASHEE